MGIKVNGTLVGESATVAAADITDIGTTGIALVQSATAAAGRAVLHERTIALSGATATNGNGTATAATGTVSLPGSATTSTFANAPHLSILHAGRAFGFDCACRVAAFTGGTVDQQLRVRFAHDGSTAATTSAVADVRVYGNGSFDAFAGGGSAAITAYGGGALSLDGDDWLRVRQDGGVTTIWTGRGSALASVVWTLRYSGVTSSTLPLADSARTYLVVSLDAQVGGAGTVSAQVTSVTWTDLT